MNTLTKTQTAPFFGSDERYAALERHWSTLVNSPTKNTLGPEHHLLYQALRGKDWRRGFAPITNRRKLENGAFYNWGLHRALRRFHLASAQEKLLEPFSGLVDLETLQMVRSLLPKYVEDFAIAQAYEVPGDD